MPPAPFFNKAHAFPDEEGGAEGVGIAPEHIPRLTERFYRVDNGRSRHNGGTGLGLAITRCALAKYHCRLEIESTPGKGSVFSVKLPLA